MKNKIKNLSQSKTHFLLELFEIPIDYFITIGEMKELCDLIIDEGAKRGLTLREKDVVAFLRRGWCESQTAHLVEYEIVKTNVTKICEEKPMGKILLTLKRNNNRLIQRRGKVATKEYLRKLIKEYPDYATIFENALREIR